MGFEIIGRKTLRPAIVLENKNDLAILSRRDMEIIHRFVPHRHLRARHVAALRPSMRLAFDEDRRDFATEIEPVRLLRLADANRYGKVLRKHNALLCEERLRGTFEIISGMRVAKRTDSLKIIDIHVIYPILPARLE